MVFCRSHIIVDGVSLLFMPNAHYRLEENGMALVKDATAKEGIMRIGVDVLVTLALSED